MNKDIKIGDYIIALRKRKSRIKNEITVRKGDIGQVTAVYPKISAYGIDFSKGSNKKVILEGKWICYGENIFKIPDFLIPNIKAMSGYKEKPDVGDWICVLDKGWAGNKVGVWGKVLETASEHYHCDFSKDVKEFTNAKAVLKKRKIRVVPALELKGSGYRYVYSDEFQKFDEFQKSQKIEGNYLKISDLSLALSLCDIEQALKLLPPHPIFDSILRIRKEAEKSQRFAKDYREIFEKIKIMVTELNIALALNEMEEVKNSLDRFLNYFDTLYTDNLYLKK